MVSADELAEAEEVVTDEEEEQKEEEDDDDDNNNDEEDEGVARGEKVGKGDEGKEKNNMHTRVQSYGEFRGYKFEGQRKLSPLPSLA